MEEHLLERIIKEAEYIIENGATVRQTAKVFNYSKSTVHKDVSERLYYIDTDLFKKVKKVLRFNFSIRHIRGGEATKRKYQKVKSN